MTGEGPTSSVGRDQFDATVRPVVDLCMGAQTDRRIERRGSIVEQIQWPDVDSSTSEVDAGRRGRYDGHGRIIDCLIKPEV